MATRNRPRLVRTVLGFCCVALLAAAAYSTWSHWELVQAWLAYRGGDWRAARRHAESYCQAHPQSQWGLLVLARSARELGDWPRAELMYQRMQWVPVQDLQQLAAHYGALASISADPTAAQYRIRQTQIHERIRSIDTHDVDNLIALGHLYEKAFGNHHQAITYFEQVTQLAPERVDGWAGLALSYVESGEHVKATECLVQAIALKPPEVWRLHWLRGEILLDKIGDVPGAGKELRRAIELNPDDVDSLISLSEWSVQQSPPDLAAAREYLKRALRIDGKNQKALGRLASLERAAPPSLPGRMDRAHWYFTDVSEPWGVTFRHNAGENQERRYFPETLGSGVAVFDYDGDGNLDLYFVNYNFLGPDDARRSPTIRNTLYRNRGDGTFEDVTEASGLGDDAPGHGVAIGDFDNDGDPDVYVTNYGPNKLFRNNGDGTFSDVTHESGAADRPESMSTSAAWFDCDNDGDLDLYVCNYSIYDVNHPVDCSQQGRPIYCGPDGMESQRHTFFRNNGDGTFSDVTEEMGIARNESKSKMGKGLGVVAAHLNDDDFIDLAVANDSTPNFVFFGDGSKLVDVTDTCGAAVNKDYEKEASMGIAVGDVDGDGDLDLFVTNQFGEKNTLYLNTGGLFRDESDLFGLTAPTRQAVGWGTALVDFDNDGDLDLFVTNGHFYDWRDAEPFRQKATLWENTGTNRFESVGERAGPFFTRELVGRGAAFGDLDNDGDTDIVLNHWNEGCAVLRNDTESVGTWIRLELVGTASNRDAVGTRFEVEAGGRTFYRELTGGGSYLSAHDPRPLIGLGPAPVVEHLRVRWPSGRAEEFASLQANRSYRLVEGKELQAVDGPLAQR